MAEGIGPYEAICDAPVVRQLLGGMPADVPERYADASPAKLLPLRVPQIMIWGSKEVFVPVSQLEHYTAAAEMQVVTSAWLPYLALVISKQQVRVPKTGQQSFDQSRRS